MPSVCDCPFCGQPAAIPEDLDSESAVQCPHCQYEFPGDRALMYAVEAPPEHVAELPPALLRVGASHEGTAAESPAPTDGQGSAGEDGGDGPTPAVSVAEQSDAAPIPDAGDLGERLKQPPQAAATQAGEPEAAAEPTMQPAAEGPEMAAMAAALPAEGDGTLSTEPSGELASALESPQSEAETSPSEATHTSVAAVEPVPASEASAAGPVETGVPGAGASSEAGAAAAVSLALPEKAPDATLPVWDRPSPTRHGRRKRNPVRTAVGVAVSGLLGLAVPYGAWVGLSKLGIVGRARPPAATGNRVPADSRSASPDSTMVPPPQPTEFDEWPGLDENRFAVEPKEAKKEEKPSVRAKKGK